MSLWFQTCREVYPLIHIWELLVLLFMKSLICVICAYSHSFLVCKLYNSCLQIMHLLLDHLRFMGSVQLEVFSSCNIKKSQFQFLVSTACCFFNYICWSVNCMSWVSKFNNFFLRCTETETRFIFEFFKYCALWKVHFQHSGTFLAFFIRSVSCSRDIFNEFASHWIAWVES